MTALRRWMCFAIALCSLQWHSCRSARSASAPVDLTALRSDEIAIVQFDSRRLLDYWLVAAQWNSEYSHRHGHRFIYYSLRGDSCYYDYYASLDGDVRQRREKLAPPWCKVKAMLSALRDFPSVKFFIYMDSDAVIDKRFANTPLQDMLGVMQQRLAWDPSSRPIVFNQDGPCWWCSLVESVGYQMCLNAGTVAWYRHEVSEQVLQSWWDSCMDPYGSDPIKRLPDMMMGY